MKTKQILAIAEAHIQARIDKKFDYPLGGTPIKDGAELVEIISSGKTVEALIEEIEYRYCSVTSILIANSLGGVSNAYRAAVRKAFRLFFSRVPESAAH
jgi:hypothetical protein